MIKKIIKSIHGRKYKGVVEYEVDYIARRKSR